MNPAPTRSRSRQLGVGLVETMVGLTLGLIMTLIITQVWGSFEAQKQRTVSGASTQVNGVIAMTQVEQDLRNAGAGLADSAAFSCSTTYSYYASGTATVSPIPAYSGNLAPVQITDGGAGPDTMVIKRSGDLLGSLPATISQTMPQSSSELNLNSTAGFADGDIVMAVDATTGNCTVMMVTQVQGAALKLQHNPGGTTTYNPAIVYQTANAWPAYTSGAKLVKMGQTILHTYSVDAGQLTLTDSSDPLTTTTSVLSADIVDLQAQYGIADAGSQTVNAWVNPTAATGWDTLDATEIRRIKAVRMAIAVRSPQKEATDVTAPCKDAGGTVVNANGPCVWADSEPVLNLSADADWKRYRYRIYQTIVPLRNVIWAGI